MSPKVVTRFPPSPTGPLHIGNVRTALFNYLFAKHHGGDFAIRIEDTDKARSKKEYEADMLENLEWLGLRGDGALWRQSERAIVYKKYLSKLIDENKAYLSNEIEGDPTSLRIHGAWHKEVIRFKNANRIIAFDDLVRGRVEFDTTELGDFIIARNLDEPLYHLAVVVDDFETGVTHVIRGEDHISNTPRQILLQEALGIARPTYAHLPLILAPDRSKLSKRQHGESVSLNYYRAKGYLPEAILNYLALLGWNPGTAQEIFTMAELVAVFDISKVHQGGAIFDEKKLAWVHRQHVHFLSPVAKQKMIAKDFDVQKALMLDSRELCWKSVSSEETVRHLLKAKEILMEGGDGSDSGANLMAYAEAVGKGNVLWPVRYALSGERKSPDPLTLIAILGREESMKRIEQAVAILK